MRVATSIPYKHGRLDDPVRSPPRPLSTPRPQGVGGTWSVQCSIHCSRLLVSSAGLDGQSTAGRTPPGACSLSSIHRCVSPHPPPGGSTRAVPPRRRSCRHPQSGKTTTTMMLKGALRVFSAASRSCGCSGSSGSSLLLSGAIAPRRESRRFFREKKRVYSDVSITHGEGGMFEVNLDRRKLRTPQGKLFAVPSEGLAVAVATEWDMQKNVIQMHSMHLTTLCNTALDNPTHRTPEQLASAALKYLDTDTICYRMEEPPALVSLQQGEWDPVLSWAEERYGVTIGSSTSIMGPEIPQETRNTLNQHLLSYNTWALIGLEYVVMQLKSLVLTLALVDRHLNVEEAVLLSRLEEEFQIARWGNVEWAHDLDILQVRARTAAGALFVCLSCENAVFKHKLLANES